MWYYRCGYVFCDWNGYLNLIKSLYKLFLSLRVNLEHAIHCSSPLISPLSLALLFVHSDMFKTYPKQFGRIVADPMSWPTDQPWILQNMLSVECVRFCIKGCRVSMIVRIMLVLLLYNHHNYCSSQACLGASRIYARAGRGGKGHVQQGPAISFVALRNAISNLWIFLFLLDCDWCLLGFLFSIVHIACLFLRPVSLEH